MNRSQAFLESLDGAARLALSPEVAARARQSLADYLAVTCAGARCQREKLKRYFDFARPELGAFRVIGTGRDLALKEAVFLNALNAHALDLDDGTNAGIIHLGAPVFSLLLPLAERYDLTVGDVLRAAVAGYEAGYTLAVSIQPKHKALGWHATGTCGAVGAALAASYLTGLSPDVRENVFAAAAISASGMLKALDGDSDLKPYNAAKAALLALTSLEVAAAGFRGDGDALGGRGFVQMMTGGDAEIKNALDDGEYAIMKTYTKPYASCRYTHPAIDAALAIRSEYAFEASEIKSVSVETYALAVPGHDHTAITGVSSAKMSLPFAAAAALACGAATLREFSEENVGNEEILSLARKVRVASNEEFSRLFPEKQIAKVTVATDRGEFSRRVDYPKGEPENPLSEAEFAARFFDLTAYAGLAEDDAKRVYELAHDDGAPVGELVKKL